jgi:hypothetical protein
MAVRGLVQVAENKCPADAETGRDVQGRADTDGSGGQRGRAARGERRGTGLARSPISWLGVAV